MKHVVCTFKIGRMLKCGDYIMCITDMKLKKEKELFGHAPLAPLKKLDIRTLGIRHIRGYTLQNLIGL